MKRILVPLLFILVVLGLSGCRSKEKEHDRFAIYLLADDFPSSQLLGTELDQLPLQDKPILTSQDIISYSKETHEIELTRSAFERIERLFSTPVKVDGLPFVVCVGQQRIYSGAFWTPLSSLSFDGIVILQPFDVDRRMIKIDLGYPGPDFFMGEDPRPDPRILQSFEAEQKLK